MKEDVVSFGLAMKLKEKGFREEVNAYYGKWENLFDVHPALDMNDCDYRASAPTISQVLKWMREEKKIFIQMGLVEYKWEYMCFDINTIADNFYGWHKAMLKGDKVRFFESYEQAALAGIEYCLDNLI